MKYLMLVVFSLFGSLFLSDSESNDYDKLWKQVAKEERQMPKSAYKIVEQIYDLAKDKGDEDQLIKAIIYKVKLSQTFEDKDPATFILELESELTHINAPSTKAVFSSLLGEMYASYAMANAYRFSQRTNIAEPDPEGELPFNSLAEIQKKAFDYYIASLTYDGSAKLLEVDILLQKSDQAQPKVRAQNIEQFLHFRALQHFTTSTSTISLPTNAYLFNQEEIYDEAFELKAGDPDKVYNDFGLTALRVFGDTKRLSGLSLEQSIWLEVNRLDFVNQHATISDKKDRYKTALLSLGQKHHGQQGYEAPYIKLINLYLNEGQQSKTSESYKDSYTQAATLLDELLEEGSSNYYTQFISSLRDRLEKEEYAVEVEQVNFLDKAFLAKLNYRNSSALEYKITRLEDDAFSKYQRTYKSEEKIAFVSNLPTVTNGRLELKQAEDHKWHSIEFPIQGLSAGRYAMLLQHKAGKSEGVISVFHVSNLAYISLDNYEGGMALGYVTDRISGEPLSDVNVEVYTEQYDHQTRANKWNRVAELKSDRQGRFEYKSKERNVFYKLTKGKDYLDLREGHYSGRHRLKNKYQEVVLFTDRAIYRPGQLVYVKGLVVEYSEERIPSIVAGQKVQLVFRDANYQEIKTLDLEANEYGTFHTAMTAPENGLTGAMTIEARVGRQTNQKRIRVEEYKRPKLFLELDKLSKAYSLGDSVTVLGTLKNFSGSIVDDAVVNYRVERSMRSWFRYGYYGGRNQSNEQVASGSVRTNADGSFTVDFLTKSGSDTYPYNYVVHIDAVDATGESVNSKKSFVLSPTPFYLKVELPEYAELNTYNPSEIEVLNSENERVEVNVEMEVTAIESPSKVKRKRYWDYPELQYLPESEFKSLFPYDAYVDETDKSKWVERGVALILKEEMVSTLPLEELSDLPPGVYKLDIKATDEKGRESQLVRYISLFDRSSSAPAGLHFWISTPKESYQPGDEVILALVTDFKEAEVLYTITDKNGKAQTEWKSLPQSRQVRYVVKEADRGNINLDFMMIKEGRTYSQRIPIVVPWTNKELKIEYNTFRDELEPGAKEEWELVIKDMNGKAISGELLATMYDASLDQFVSHNWKRNFFPTNALAGQIRAKGFGKVNGQVYLSRTRYNTFHIFGYSPQLNTFGLYLNRRGRYMDEMAMESSAPIMKRAKTMQASAGAPEAAMADTASADFEVAEEQGGTSEWANNSKENNGTSNEVAKDNFSLRENLNETVFFYPSLSIIDGKATLKFKMNEALTKWNLLLFAHNKELQYTFDSKSILTQKPLMIEPHMPRFVRQGDLITINGKVSNLSDNTLETVSHIEIVDALSGKDITALFLKDSGKLSASLASQESTTIEWQFYIPEDYLEPIAIKMWTEGGGHSDGEQNLIPVLTNRKLVTETLPIHVSAESVKTISLDAMAKMNSSSSLVNHNYSLEFNVNPAWIVVKAIPQLTASSNPSSTELINAVYGNLLMQDILTKQPSIKKVIAGWTEEDLKSNLSKNEDLKINDLNNTPWVRSAIQEEEQRRQLKLHLDENYQQALVRDMVGRLKQRQTVNGGFSWMPGGRDNWYVTQNILEKIGHLSKLGIEVSALNAVVNPALSYIDNAFAEYDRKRTKRKNEHLDPIAIHYLYVRSFFTDQKLESKTSNLIGKYLKLCQEEWMNKSNFQEALIALAAQRFQEENLAKKILESLKEKMTVNEILGSYWNDQAGYYWYNNNVDKQAIMIELFHELGESQEQIDGLKLWLLKNKQTNSWKSSKATALACYAFILDNAKWLSTDGTLDISFPLMNEAVTIPKAELATGYFRKDWSKEKVQPEMSEIKVSNPNKNVSWGAAYWQYFEDLDKIEQFNDTPLTINKAVYKVAVDESGELLEKITTENTVAPGDKLRIRIELQVDRPMEFIEMKDMRSSGLEPMNVLSQYRWQDGLSYYESTKDRASYFYFDFLPKGNWVFEYDVKAAHVGKFSNGITEIQSMYAPEFSSHSKGIQIEVTK